MPSDRLAARARRSLLHRRILSRLAPRGSVHDTRYAIPGTGLMGPTTFVGSGKCCLVALHDEAWHDLAVEPHAEFAVGLLALDVMGAAVCDCAYAAAASPILIRERPLSQGWLRNESWRISSQGPEPDAPWSGAGGAGGQTSSDGGNCRLDADCRRSHDYSSRRREVSRAGVAIWLRRASICW